MTLTAALFLIAAALIPPAVLLLVIYRMDKIEREPPGMLMGLFFKGLLAMIPILIPLFVSSFRSAYDLSIAMECRCYHGGEGRTRMKQLHTAPRDWVALAVYLLVGAGIVAINILT